MHAFFTLLFKLPIVGFLLALHGFKRPPITRLTFVSYTLFIHFLILSLITLLGPLALFTFMKLFLMTSNPASALTWQTFFSTTLPILFLFYTQILLWARWLESRGFVKKYLLVLFTLFILPHPLLVYLLITLTSFFLPTRKNALLHNNANHPHSQPNEYVVIYKKNSRF